MVGSKFWLIAVALVGASVVLGWMFVIASPFLALSIYPGRFVMSQLRSSWRRVFDHSVSPNRVRFFVTSGDTRSRGGRRFEAELEKVLKANHLHGCACVVERPNFSQGTIRLWGDRGAATVDLNAQNTTELAKNVFQLAKTKLDEVNWQKSVNPCVNCNSQTCPIHWAHIKEKPQFTSNAKQ